MDNLPLASFASPQAGWHPALIEFLQQGALQNHLRQSRWFGGKSRALRSVHLAGPVPGPWPDAVRFFLLEVTYEDGGSERYALPLGLVPEEAGLASAEIGRAFLLARTTGHLVVEALVLPHFREALVAAFEPSGFDPTGLQVEGSRLGEVLGRSGRACRLEKVEQSNASLSVGRDLWLKFYRKLEPGELVEVELMRRLQSTGRFPHVPAIHAALRLPAAIGAGTLAVLMEKVAHQGDGWSRVLTLLRDGFEDLKSRRSEGWPKAWQDGLARAEQLGRRTAQMHQALADEHDGDGRYLPEPWTKADAGEWRHHLCGCLQRLLAILMTSATTASGACRELARKVVEGRAFLEAMGEMSEEDFHDGAKIRIHDDLHLAQVLDTGTDFVFIDFEGEPSRPMSERRQKRPALKDVAGMIRSYDYAAAAAVKMLPEDEAAGLAPMAKDWAVEAGRQFLRGYREAAAGAVFLPRSAQAFAKQLDALLLEKAAAEALYELNYRPAWADIPLQALCKLIDPGETALAKIL